MGGKSPRRPPAGERRPGRAFNPVWLVDVLGLAGLATFAWSVGWADAPLSEYVGPARAAGLLLAGCALIVRGLGWVLSHRDRRGQARREFGRRMGAVNEALFDLRRSLSRDNARAFADRCAELAAGQRLCARWLSAEELRLASTLSDVCGQMDEALGATVQRRIDLTSHAQRLSREIERADRRGDLDHNDADNLLGLVDDALATMDEAIYAEWNADHFGRLTADRRAFAREVERYRSEAASQIEQHGSELFDQLFEHVNRKVEAADLIVDWDDAYRKLELRLAGVSPDKVRVLPVRPAPAAPSRPRLTERFTPRPRTETPEEGEQPRVRLSAAND